MVIMSTQVYILGASIPATPGPSPCLSGAETYVGEWEEYLVKTIIDLPPRLAMTVKRTFLNSHQCRILKPLKHLEPGLASPLLMHAYRGLFHLKSYQKTKGLYIYETLLLIESIDRRGAR